MKLQLHRARICVEFEHPVVVRDVGSLDLVGIGGRAWVTIEGDPRDILLERGGKLHVEPGNNVVVSGMPLAEVEFVAAASPATSRRNFADVVRRLGAAWRSLRFAQRLQGA
ncbi:MAG TPA: DUF2917 domain-containing protein [Burkholderiaceae bacterium]|nr:DUF2917 domain-containing protein [Burkholderiaceae bacterium]HYA76642.1 DUF2917 domain-containing protein [Burkholderiaceae bacterium]